MPVHVIRFTAQLPTFLGLEVIQLEQAVFDAGGMHVVPHPERPGCREKPFGEDVDEWVASLEIDATEKRNLRNFPSMPESSFNEKELSHWNPNLDYSVAVFRRPTWSGIRTSGTILAR